jgi:hypothetical protein
MLGDLGSWDELRIPIYPGWYSDEFGRLLEAAALRRITLHDSITYSPP